MKLRKLFIAIALLLSCVAIQAQNNLFEKLSNNKNIASVYISKTMMGMTPNLGNMGGANIQDLVSKLDQIEIYSSETNDAASYMKKEIDALVNNRTYELLMNVKDGNEIVTFYAQKNKEGKDKFREMIMATVERGNYIIVRMVGNFTAEDIQKIVTNTKK